MLRVCKCQDVKGSAGYGAVDGNPARAPDAGTAGRAPYHPAAFPPLLGTIGAAVLALTCFDAGRATCSPPGTTLFGHWSKSWQLLAGECCSPG